MNILHLRYAVEVASTGSINKAAENLYMNQPNLSRAIKELEENLGIAIFERTTRGMIVTREGEQFLEYARKILAQIDEVENIYKRERGEKQRFSASVPRASYIAEAFLALNKYIDKKEASEIFYQETNSMTTVSNIVNGICRLGIIRYASNYDSYFKRLLEEKNLSYELITEFGYVAAMSEKHELAKEKTVIMISHRLANAINSNNIFVINNGTVVENGTHTKLIEQSGYYAELFNKQQNLENFNKGGVSNE